MLTQLVPRRLQSGDTVRVVAPSRSMSIISPDNREFATGRFEAMGLTVTFGAHVDECDQFGSTSIEHRVADLHEAFADPTVDAIFTAIGGYNSNQLLPYLNWDMIGANPKIFCGYSDITALSCAMHARTGLVTYSGPHFSTFAMHEHFDQTLRWFRAALWTDEPVHVEAAATWSDDPWYLDQQARDIRRNDGYWALAQGLAAGRLIGGNLTTFNALHGTGYLPDLRQTIVFVEDDFESSVVAFDRGLTSLTQQPGFDAVRGVIIGRFEPSVGMTRAMLEAIVGSKSELAGIPVVANVDTGHTDPLLTLPVGGTAELMVDAGDARLVFAS